ncbi:MAG: hypothetical protein H6620_03265 [Halobacteriovoraceae bacterium]|nr:hypothetical protein [Halobacteriovoraceae bacterium]
MKSYLSNVIFSHNDDPYFNLAYENKILRDSQFWNKTILFVWRSRPAIIMGRFQNPWLEINLENPDIRNLCIVRRQSGGGCVYHDLGNFNFSFIGANLDTNKNFQVITDFLKNLGLNVEVNKRNDILLKSKKISGSAFKNTKDSSLHHYTLLVDTDLSSISQLLHHQRLDMPGKAIESQTSIVGNVQSELASVTRFNFFEHLEKYFHEYSIQELRSYCDDKTLAYQRELESWNWVFGETPKFTWKIPLAWQDQEGELVLHSHKGKILEGFVVTQENKINIIELSSINMASEDLSKLRFSGPLKQLALNSLLKKLKFLS